MSRTTTTATVNLDEADPKKAVSRGRSDSGEELSPEERRNSTWLDRNRGVQKRLARQERQLKGQFSQQLAEQEARFQRELRDRDARLDKLTADRASDVSAADEAQHETEMKALEAEQIKAMDAGDSAKVAELSRKMARKEAEFMQKKTQAMLGRTQQSSQRKDDGGGDQRKPAGQTKAQQFIAANKHWWDSNVAARGYANELYAKASAEGKDLDSDSLYERIAKKLKKQFPDLDLRGLDDDDEDLDDDDLDDPDDLDDEDDDDEDEEEQRPAARQAAVPSFRQRSRQQNGRRNGTYRITPADEDAMRSIGLDPANNSHVLQWSREGRALDEV